MEKKTLYFDNQCGLSSYVVAVDGKLSECVFEPADNKNIVGNIYKGRVTNLLNGMQAAFVDCGLERNCYVSVEDLFPDRSKFDGTEIDIPATLNLNIGDEIMVQVVKAPIGKKGAKVTTNISFVGRYCIYMPTTPFIGVSRKITDPELRKNLIFSAMNMRKDDEGIIVRTAAPYAIRKLKLEELIYFRKMYQTVLAKFQKANVGDMIYSISPLHMRVLRDADYSSLDKIYVGTSQLEESVNSVLKIIPPAKSIPIIHCAEDKDMFHTMGLHEQMLAIMRPRVDLENGAYLIIERTEALTSIDVNTGKYTGENSLEETVFNTNMLAAAEIARQVKLRNIGGIVVVDFIDMNDEAHQTAVVQTLEKALSEDRAKCKVAPMSRFGLVEFTRKRVGVSPMNFMINSCKHCGGAGDTRSQEFILFDVRAKLMDILSEGNTTITLDMNYDLAQKLFSWQEMCDSIKRSYPTSKVYVIPHRTYAEDTITFTVLPSPAIDNHNAKLLY